MSKKQTAEEVEKSRERATEALRRQVDAALNSTKFAKSSVGRYAEFDLGEARRWLKTANQHLNEATDIVAHLEGLETK